MRRRDALHLWALIEALKNRDFTRDQGQLAVSGEMEIHCCEAGEGVAGPNISNLAA